MRRSIDYILPISMDSKLCVPHAMLAHIALHGPPTYSPVQEMGVHRRNVLQHQYAQ